MPFPNRRVPLQDSLMCSQTSICKNEKERERVSLPSVSHGGGEVAPPPPAGLAVLKVLDVPGCTLDFLLRWWGGTVLQLFVHDHYHTPFTKLQHVVSLLYNVLAYVCILHLCTSDFLLRRGGRDCVAALHDHTPFTKLQHVMSLKCTCICMYTTPYCLVNVN